DHHCEGHCGEHFADQNDEAEDSRYPAGIERHHPIDGGERNGEAVEDEAWPADGFEASAVVGCAAAVGFFRPFRQEERKYIPHCEIKYCANDKSVPGQIGLRDLFEMFAEMFVFNVRKWLGPNVQVA